MSLSVINMDTFEQPDQLGLVFSLFDSLKDGGEIKLVSTHDLEYIKDQIVDAKVHNLKFIETHSKGLTEVVLKKISSHDAGGCCGVCGS